jgi:abortive infection bacteriophage resistance protein
MPKETGYFFMADDNFEKPPLTPEQLVKKLVLNNIIVNSSKEAERCIETIGYYRLSAYFLPFQKPSEQGSTFKKGITFENIWQVYSFDKELRLLVSDALETIEVTFRACLTNAMSHKYGAHWYVQSDRYIGSYFFEHFIKIVDVICKKKEEAFLKHYFKKYNHPKYPPSWMIMECLPFGTLGQLLKNIRSISDKKEICRIFEKQPVIIESWLDSLRYSRNICAHHSRLWNRWFVVAPKHAHDDIIPCPKRSFCEQAHIIVRLLKAIGKTKSLDWKSKLCNLFEKYSQIPIEQMGFNKDWRQDSFWEA